MLAKVLAKVLGRVSGLLATSTVEGIMIEKAFYNDNRYKRDLNTIVRKARLAEAERSEAEEVLLASEYARLEILRDELKEIIEQLPSDTEQFSMQIIPGNSPKFWIDILAHVRIGEDKRTYKFIKDTFYGRIMLFQSASASQMADVVSDYLAGRLLERKKALDFDTYGTTATICRKIDKPAAKPDKNPGKIWNILSVALFGMALGMMITVLGYYYLVL